MAGDDVVSERGHVAGLPGVVEELEGAEAHVRRRQPHQHRARLHVLAVHRRAAAQHAQRPRGGDAQGVQGLSGQVLAQGGAQHRAPVASAREGRGAAPFRCRSHFAPSGARTSPRSSARPSPRRGTYPPNWCPAYTMARGSMPGRGQAPPNTRANSGCVACSWIKVDQFGSAAGLKLDKIRRLRIKRGRVQLGIERSRAAVP